MKIYAVDDSVSSVVAPEDRPGPIGRMIGMCDGDTIYIESEGTGMCLVLNGPLGDVSVQGSDQGAVLPPTSHDQVLAFVGEQGAGSGPTTRVLLEYDGAFVGLVPLSALTGMAPVTAAPVD